MFLRRIALIGVPAVVLALGMAGTASANLVSNGDFATFSGPTQGGQVGFNVTLPGWNIASPPGSYGFIFAAGGGGASGTYADNGGVASQYGNVQLYGPGNGGTGGPQTLGLSPDGNNFFASDPAFQNSALTQTISGLQAGNIYSVSFDYAVGEQVVGNPAGSSGGWTVDLGSAQPVDFPIDRQRQGLCRLGDRIVHVRRGWQQRRALVPGIQQRGPVRASVLAARQRQRSVRLQHSRAHLDVAARLRRARHGGCPPPPAFLIDRRPGSF